VDTGSTYTWLPRDLLRRLGLSPTTQRSFVLADNRQVTYGVTWTMVTLEGETLPTLVIFGAEGSEPLLGLVTLEEFGLGVDPVDERLVPVRALLKTLVLP